jgi:hypothetical protein
VRKTDHCKWLKDQAKFLRTKQFEKLDSDELAIEIDFLELKEEVDIADDIEMLMFYLLSSFMEI